MNRVGSPARLLMRTLRTGLSQPPGSDLSSLLPLARQTLAFIDREAADDPATAGEASDLAFLLAALLEAGDETFRRQAFGLLFRLGVEGEVLAVIHLETMPEDQALSILAGLTEEEKLLFANAFFRRPRTNRPRTEAFGLAALGEAVEKAPDELLILLDLLANRHEYPALPLRNALVRGRLGMWLRKLLQMDLTAEQIRYMSRVAGRLRDPGLAERLAIRLGDLDELSAEAVCHALAETPGLNAAVVGPPLLALAEQATEPSLVAAALTALGHCDPTKTAAATAARLTRQPEHLPVLAAVMAGLPLAGFGACLRALPSEKRGEALGAVYIFLAAALPEHVQAAARAVCSTGAHPADVQKAFLADLTERTRIDSHAAMPPPPPPAQTKTKEEGANLWKRVRSLVAAPGGAEDNATAKALRQELAEGGQWQDRQILWKTLDGAVVKGATLTRCSLKAVSLTQAAVADATFTDCQFADVNFERARVERTSFNRCRFNNCRFSQSVFDTVRFTDCELRLCDFGGLSARKTVFSMVDAMECDFFTAGLTDVTLEQVRLRAVSLVRAVSQGLTIRGALFSDCLFEMATLPGTTMESIRTEGCYFAGSHFSGATDEPDILGAMAKDEGRSMAEAADGPPLPAILAGGPGLRLVAATVDALLFSRDIRRRRLAMLANNKRRLAWARHRLGPDSARFLDMLPGLVEANLVRDADGVRPAPPARVRGYVPDLPTARNLANQCGQPAQALRVAPDDALTVEAIYTIGSAGTVAQTQASDLDIWVCLDAASANHPDRPAFEEKLETISRQADRELDLEIHFFVMTAQDIRDNVFGYSEDEGYGSAQGCLLKEEFYRTSLILCGRKPAWWLAPAGIPPEGYARAVAGLARAEPEAAADSLDFGCVDAIAGDAFFGASLWMIVKSLTSPFKSVIKFGLLEKYAAEGGEPALLCETLKKHIFTRQGGMWRCDPYALLFSEVSRHYQNRESAGVLELLRQAFLQKTGLDPCEDYRTRTGQAILDHFFPYAPPAGNCPPPPQREAPAGEESFAHIVSLGDAITTYLLRAYERLKTRGAALADAGGLSERDQTMLSRRIAASFAQRVGKIMRMPFIRPERGFFESLEITFEELRTKEKETVFTVQGESTGADRKNRQKETVRQDASIIRLTAWLVANELYRPGQYLQAGTLPAPLALPDITGLLAAIHDLFPPADTFSPPLSWGLSPERITAALVVVNFLSPREEKTTRSADLLYATSWGELFHVERHADLDLLAHSPAAFLTEKLGLPVDPHLRLAIYAPPRSQCQLARAARME